MRDNKTLVHHITRMQKVFKIETVIVFQKN